MQIYLQFRVVMGQNLTELNQCHMYLQAIFLSNICNGMGTAINPQMLEGKVQCPSIYEWPKTDKPSPTEWQEWRCTLMLALSLGRSEQQAIPLGKWKPEKCNANGFFLEPNNNHLIEHQDKQWFCYTRVPG